MGTLLLASVLLLGADPFAGWPQFRGPTGDGLAAAQGLPLAWGPEENVAWRTAIPGTCRSSPVVLGDRIWVTTAKSACSAEFVNSRVLPVVRDRDATVPPLRQLEGRPWDLSRLVPPQGDPPFRSEGLGLHAAYYPML